MTKQEFLKAVLEAFDANTPIAGLLGLHTPPSN
jgi:hypothetical protein